MPEEQSVARGDRVIELERRLVEERSKATDAAKFAEREYERVCEERNRLHKALAEGNGVEDGGIWEDRAIAAEAKLAQVREPAEQLIEYLVYSECARCELVNPERPACQCDVCHRLAELIGNLRGPLNDSDSTEVDNG